jgi:hypothetical protein
MTDDTKHLLTKIVIVGLLFILTILAPTLESMQKPVQYDHEIRTGQ